MENFIVSARKYRPVTFESVVGQQHVTGTLKNAIKNNQLAQAFLFCGPRGVGKTTCARILAKTINCTNPSEQMEACGTCDSCKTFQNGQSFNFHELDAASNNSVDDIRSLIEQVRIPPQSGKYKIYIIDEVHMLSSSAFNAFLKTLEEPPPYAIFILATTEKHKILPTILSRCQIFDFNRIKVEDIANHLATIAQREQVNADPNGLYIIAQKADGGLRDALSMFDQLVSYTNKQVTYDAVIENLNILDYDYYFKLTDFLINAQISNTLLLFNDILNKGFDGNNFINGLAVHLRNLLVGKDATTIQLLEVSENIKQQYLAQCKNIDVSFILTALNLANHCDLNYKNSKNQRLQVELALIKMCHIRSVIQLAAEQSDPNADKKKTLNKSERIATPIAKASVIDYIPKEKVASTISTVPKASEVESKTAAKPTAKKSAAMLIPSLTDFNLGAVEENNEPQYIRGDKREAFSDIALLQLWDEYANQAKRNDKINLYTLMTGHKPEINGTSIGLLIENIALESTLQEERIDLLNFLRSRLNNFDIDIVSKRIEIKQSDRIYSNKDKYAYLLEKNPQLDTLRTRFNLDIQP
jgi:DNA polymerase-3 subunit gamma/tau